MNIDVNEYAYADQHLLNMCLSYFEGVSQSCPSLTQLESAVVNLEYTDDAQDQQTCNSQDQQTIDSQDQQTGDSQDQQTGDVQLSIEVSTDDSDVESDSEFNTAFNSSSFVPPPHTFCGSPVYTTPPGRSPPLPSARDVIEFSIDPDETIEWADDAFESAACVLAASYDTFCRCCNNPVRIELFRSS
jgi:hypothetical protein